MSRLQKNTVRLSIALTISLFFYSCKKDADKIVPYKAGPGLYVSGFIAADSSWTAAAWKDGTNMFLKGSRALGIISNGNDVYIIGTSNDNPVYWKNGVMVSLPPPPAAGRVGNGTPEHIAVAGNDVYVTGYYSYNNGDEASVYWKNGVLTTLSNQQYVIDIAASGNDIYMLMGDNTRKQFYLKNNVRTDIPNFYATHIAASGNDVCLAGSMLTNTGSLSDDAAYWKNGVITKIGSNVYINNIVIKDNDIYVAGYDNTYGSSYWKNGVPTRLTPPPRPKLSG